MAAFDHSIELSPAAAKTVRHALLAGLAGVAEIERVIRRAEDASVPVVLPRHPTESDDVISTFVEALALLD